MTTTHTPGTVRAEAVTRLGDSPRKQSFTWADYNISKLEWLRANRGASGAEIEVASRRIADEMGL